ncbi:hypothetical protein I79_018348 [Cricetulus griseus]|uniref:Uncharacterized protein n=1 Tax=Cricetulus griseus TaxID=10029 RepID=G3I4G9_CRIGR|nr:hypothetical protein I79_018348 [Cricetulus griseus]
MTLGTEKARQMTTMTPVPLMEEREDGGKVNNCQVSETGFDNMVKRSVGIDICSHSCSEDKARGPSELMNLRTAWKIH